MHENAKKFLHYCRRYINHASKVLDVGSQDLNGNNRWLFPDSDYIGCDIECGNNVDIVASPKDLKYKNEYFDVIISTECFEHNPTLKEDVEAILRMLKPDGLLITTCASIGREPHMNDHGRYYKNVSPKDFNEVLQMNKNFFWFEFYYQNFTNDIYFIGKKRGISVDEPIHTIYNGMGLVLIATNMYYINVSPLCICMK